MPVVATAEPKQDCPSLVFKFSLAKEAPSLLPFAPGLQVVVSRECEGPLGWSLKEGNYMQRWNICKILLPYKPKGLTQNESPSHGVHRPQPAPCGGWGWPGGWVQKLPCKFYRWLCNYVPFSLESKSICHLHKIPADRKCSGLVTPSCLDRAGLAPGFWSLERKKWRRICWGSAFSRGCFSCWGCYMAWKPKSPQKASSKGLPAYTQASPLLVAVIIIIIW